MPLYDIDYSFNTGSLGWTNLTKTYDGVLGYNIYYWMIPDTDSKKFWIRLSESGSFVYDIEEYPLTHTKMKFRSKNYLHEHRFICVLPANEFNNSTNRSLYDENGLPLIEKTYVDSAGYTLKFQRTTDFMPYVTKIGLYDEFNNLVAVAKFNKPIKLSKNLDSVFIVKYDV